MKRLLSIGLGAFALVVAAIGVSTPAAAQTACTQVSTASWPQNATWYCGSALVTDASPVSSAVSGASGQQSSVLKRGAVQFYVVGSQAEYAGIPGHGTPNASDFAFVQYDGNHVPLHVAVFKVNGNGASNPNIPLNFMRKLGEAMDWFDGYVTNGGIQPYSNIRLSTDVATGTGTWTNVWRQEANNDWTNFNALTPCGTSGAFSTRKDQVGNFICSGATGTGATLATSPVNYASLGSNKLVLQTAWNGQYGSDALHFDEEYSVNYGQSAGVGAQSPDYYIGYFTCSNATLKYVMGNGVLPAATDLPSGCPAPATARVCLKLFSSSDLFHWPAGNVFSCVLTGTAAQTTLAGGIQGKLQSIGNSTAYVQPKGVIAATTDLIYVFATPTAYNTAFANAGVNAPAWPANAAAITWQPTGLPNIYTIDVENNDAGTDPSKQTEFMNHELGHALDYTYGSPSQSSGFITATNFDFAAMDSASPCSSSPTGPLVNVSYPVTGGGTKPFCIGTAFTTDPASAIYHQGGVATNPPKPTSQIVQDPTIAGHYFDTPFYSEWYPQAFAVQANPDDGVGGSYPTPQSATIAQIVTNGYFKCTANRTNGWLHWIYTGQTTNPTSAQLPSGCQ